MENAPANRVPGLERTYVWGREAPRTKSGDYGFEKKERGMVAPEFFRRGRKRGLTFVQKMV